MSDKRQPWVKFYGADWRANPELRLCSLAARGLWVEMLCIAHEAEPYGHVLIAGRVPSAAQIAIQVGALPKEVERLTTELEAAGVFDRSEAGAIVSRRMVRDRAKADRDAANGRGGGNPDLKPRDKGGGNPPDKAGVGEGDKAQMPDARCQKESDPEANASGAGAPRVADEVWRSGLRYLTAQGVAEKQARSLIGKWRKAHGEAAVLDALIGAERQSVSDPVPWITAALAGKAPFGKVVPHPNAPKTWQDEFGRTWEIDPKTGESRVSMGAA